MIHKYIGQGHNLHVLCNVNAKIYIFAVNIIILSFHCTFEIFQHRSQNHPLWNITSQLRKPFIWAAVSCGWRHDRLFLLSLLGVIFVFSTLKAKKISQFSCFNSVFWVWRNLGVGGFCVFFFISKTNSERVFFLYHTYLLSLKLPFFFLYPPRLRVKVLCCVWGFFSPTVLFFFIPFCLCNIKMKQGREINDLSWHRSSLFSGGRKAGNWELETSSCIRFS